MTEYITYVAIAILSFWAAGFMCNILRHYVSKGSTFTPRNLSKEEIAKTNKMFYEGEG
jgi:hypothetical protein